MSTGDAELDFHATDQLQNCIQRQRHRAEEVWTPVKLAAIAKIAHERLSSPDVALWCAESRKRLLKRRAVPGDLPLAFSRDITWTFERLHLCERPPPRGLERNPPPLLPAACPAADRLPPRRCAVAADMCKLLANSQTGPISMKFPKGYEHLRALHNQRRDVPGAT